MIGDALLAAPLYGEDYETATSRNVYLPEGKWIDYESGEQYNGPLMLSDYEIPLEKIPLFVGGTGMVVEKAGDGLKARIYPISQSVKTIFYDRDGETSSTLSIENPDWKEIEVIDKTNGKKMEVEYKRHAYEFDLVTGHDYAIQ